MGGMRIHHVALRTHDVPRLERFYAGALGLVVTRRDGERSVWLDAGGAILMLERASEGEPGIPERTMELVAFTISKTERATFEAKLLVEATTDFTIYVRDPDGRRVGLSHFSER